MQHDIYIIGDNTELLEQLNDIFQNEKEFHFVNMSSSNVDIVLKNIPTMIIIDDDNTDLTALDICKRIRTNEDNSITPIFIISSNLDHDYRMEILKLSVQYYIIKPINNDYFYMTIKNMIDFVNTNRRVSPLTGLPRKCSNSSRDKKENFKQKRICSNLFRFR